LPVAGRPGLFLAVDLCITFIDFFALAGLYLNSELMKRLQFEPEATTMQAALQSHGRPATGRPSITTLYGEFETAHAVFFKYLGELDAADAGNLDGAWHNKFERATSVCNKIANRIARAPAATLPEIMLKLRMVAWMESDVKYETLEELDHWRAHGKPGPDAEEAVHILSEIQEDLRRVAAH
jgi:hypothetical protein